MLQLSDIKPGMIGLSGGNSFIQKAIRFFTKSDFSHSFPIVNGPCNIISSFETTSTITTSNPLINKLQEPDWLEIWELVATSEDKNKALQDTFIEYSEEMYGHLSYIWFIYRWVCRLFKKEPKTVWKWAAGGVTCTELTCYYISRLNPTFAKLLEGKDLSAQSPEELIHIMESNPKLFIYRGWLKSK